MLVVALVLAVVGLAEFVTAVVTSNELVAWVCIAASVLGVILLIIDAIRERKSRDEVSVDDEAEARQVLRAILESAGAEVYTVSSWAEVLEHLTAHRPDVLIADVGMPGMDGFDLIEQVRAFDDAGVRDVPAAAGIPGPVSSISVRIMSPARRVRTVSRWASRCRFSIACSALVMRLRNTC